MKVIDSFSFFNEFEVLKLRLEYLNDIVDHFIIVEGKYTYSGKPKPYYLDEVWNDIPEDIRSKITRLKYEPDITDFKFEDEVVIGDYENSYWKLEREQRQFISQNLSQFSDEDFIMVSDCDEIPKRETIQKLLSQKLSGDFFAVAKCEMFYYNFTTLCNSGWSGTVFSTVGNAIKFGCDYFRQQRSSFDAIEKGGWHFSTFGDAEKIRYKIESFAHQEYNKEEYKTSVNILKSIQNKEDLYHNSGKFGEYDFFNFPGSLREIIFRTFSKEFYIYDTDMNETTTNTVTISDPIVPSTPPTSVPSTTNQSAFYSPKATKFNIVRIVPDNVFYNHSQVFNEIEAAIFYSLKRMGYDVTNTVNDFVPDARNIVFGMHHCKVDTVRHDVPKNTIVYSLEQMSDSPECQRWCRKYRGLEVWDYSLYNKDSLQLAGVENIKHVPIGYVPELSYFEREPVSKRDIDILAYLSPSPRRRKIMDQFKNNPNINFVHIEATYGDERDAYMARAKLIINLHNNDNKIFEMVRVTHALQQGIPVLAERGPDTDFPEYMEDTVNLSTYNRFVDTAYRLLKKPEELEASAVRALEKFKQTPMTKFLEEALK